MDRPLPITIIETPSFLRDAKKLLDESERRDLIDFLAYNPRAGVIMKDSGGLRKIRFKRESGGKSGGLRVIYFFHSPDEPLFILNVFAKNEKENIAPAERLAMKELSAALVREYRRR